MFLVIKHPSAHAELMGFVFVLFGHVCGAQQLTFSTVETSADTAVSEAVLRQAYSRLDTQLTIKKYPAERSLRLANRGLVDGEIQRIGAIAGEYENLIQVRPAINVVEAVAFTRSVTFLPQGWESLRPYRIGLIRGIKFAEMNTIGMNRYLVSRYQSLFKMLNQGRIDVAVAPRINGLVSIRKHNQSAITALKPALMNFKLFHYLHRKHRAWVPRIESVIRAMHRSGELAAIRQQVHELLLEKSISKSEPCQKNAQCGPSYFNLYSVNKNTIAMLDEN